MQTKTIEFAALEEAVDPNGDGMTQSGYGCYQIRKFIAFYSFYVDGGNTDITPYL